MILNIGSGPSQKTEGWLHLDSRPLRGVDVVADCRKLPFPDAHFEGVVASNVLEHISWRETLSTLKEWLRVVVPGGYLIIQTPDALQLVEIIQGNPHEATREGENESSWMYFSRMCFGHQDCPENAHLTYFKEDWLTELLYEAGAGIVEPIPRSHPWFIAVRAWK